MDFYKSSTAKKYYEVDVPRLILMLEKIANALQDQNLLEKEKIKEDKKRYINEQKMIAINGKS